MTDAIVQDPQDEAIAIARARARAKANAGPSKTQQAVRQAIATPEGRARLDRQNADIAKDETPSARDYLGDIGETAETVAAGIPGEGLLMSGARALSEGKPFNEAQDEINDETSGGRSGPVLGHSTDTISRLGAMGGQALGAGLTLGIPGLAALRPTASGAIIGGASGLLSNEAEGFSPFERLLRGVTGGAGGALIGGAAELGGQALAARNADPNRIIKQVGKMKILPKSETGVGSGGPVRPLPRYSPDESGPMTGLQRNLPPAEPGPKIDLPPAKVASPPDMSAFDLLPAPMRPAVPEASPPGRLVAGDQNFTSALEDLLAKVRQGQEAPGPEWTDAEIAQGIDKIKGQDLTDLIRQSVDQLQRGRTMEELARINRPPR